MTQAAALPTPKLNPASSLLGLAAWGFIIAGATTENQTLISVGAATMIGCVAIAITLKLRRSAADRAATARAWARSLPATARVLDISTNGGMNNHPRVHFDLEIRPASGSPYRAQTSAIIDRLAIPRIQPGAEITVRVDPEAPANVLIDEKLTYLGYRA